MTDDTTLVHPGTFVRENVIPAKMTTTQAAKILGIGRPALSNFLNGKASLSVEMASRLAKAFGADKDALLTLQHSFDGAQKSNERLVVSSYVPEFMQITATQIDTWADRISSRSKLAVLIRKLIGSTVEEFTEFDFPGYDNSQRRGWDGTLKCYQATPWVPSGTSGWEFGCDKNPLAKADDDYTARTNAVEERLRKMTTFVFVTPRNWPGKKNWALSKTKLGEWKAVKTLDASDLEQWMEQSVPTQIWFAEQIGIPTNGCESLDHYWKLWTEATEPKLTESLFRDAVTLHRETFQTWLTKESPKPIKVRAESKEEALAFLACMFNDESMSRWRSRAVVINSPESLRKLSASTNSFIPIVHTSDTENELIAIYKQHHCISVNGPNPGFSKSDVVLETLSAEGFEHALASMGIDKQQIPRFARECGRSRTVLRRRLSTIDSIRNPQWLKDVNMRGTVIPLALIGSWKSSQKSDVEIVELLFGKHDSSLEASIAHLLNMEDSPLWSANSAIGVVSKIDILFSINNLITKQHIESFLFIAELVLSETDPSLELEEDKRWAAGLYGKLRGHSDILRESVCDTLILLAVHGNELLQERLAMDIESQIAHLVRRLISPLTTEKLHSHDRELPLYAEAAPDTFLSLIEQDLKLPDSAVLGLIKPVGAGIFARCPRTSILWALECLAWNAANLPRVLLILGKLSEKELEDNWMNKPINTLKSIFRWWMPQTAASAEDRTKGIKLLVSRYPRIGWEVCLDQIDSENDFGSYSYKPKWRDDSNGAGNPKITNEHKQFRYEALQQCINWKSHNVKTLGDLIAHASAIPTEAQFALWDHVESWAESAGEKEKCELRECIRKFGLTLRAKGRKKTGKIDGRVQKIYDSLKSTKASVNHKWLFEKEWLEPSYDELDSENFDYMAALKRIDEQRCNAITDIWNFEGFQGILELLSEIESCHLVGRYLGLSLKETDKILDIIFRSIDSKTDLIESKRNTFLAGIMQTMNHSSRSELLIAAQKRELEPQKLSKLLTLAPFDKLTWELVSKLSQENENQYWQSVYPTSGIHDESELAEVTDKLINANRPVAAFRACALNLERLDSSRIKRILETMVHDPDVADQSRIHRSEIARAFEILLSRGDLSEDQLFNLEFQFVSVLQDTNYGLPNFSKALSRSPKLFSFAVALVTKRRDDQNDPPELIMKDETHQRNVAYACLRGLQKCDVLPGWAEEKGRINTKELVEWILETRASLQHLGRLDIGDQFIGQLLARGRNDDNEIWPSIEVCEALEQIGSEHIGKGFAIETFNSRGVYSSNGDGVEERNIAKRYRNWGKQVKFNYPYVATILERIADDFDRAALREINDHRLRTFME